MDQQASLSTPEPSLSFEITPSSLPCTNGVACRDFFCTRDHEDTNTDSSVTRPQPCPTTQAFYESITSSSSSTQTQTATTSCKNPSCKFLHPTFTSFQENLEIPSNYFIEDTKGKMIFSRSVLVLSKEDLENVKKIKVCETFYRETPGKCPKGADCENLHLHPEFAVAPSSTMGKTSTSSSSIEQYQLETLERQLTHKESLEMEVPTGTTASSPTNSSSGKNNNNVKCQVCFSKAVQIVIQEVTDEDASSSSDENEEDTAMEIQESATDFFTNSSNKKNKHKNNKSNNASNEPLFKGLFCNNTKQNPKLEERHFICRKCLSTDILQRWSTIQHEPGKIPELFCPVPDCSPRTPETAFKDTQIAKHCTTGALRKYLEVRQRARDAITVGEAQEQAQLAIREKNEKILLEKTFALSLGNSAIMCPRCKLLCTFEACSDLRAHHGQQVAGWGSAKIDNSCKHCGFFSASRSDYLPWDGKLRDENELEAKKDEFRIVGAQAAKPVPGWEATGAFDWSRARRNHRFDNADWDQQRQPNTRTTWVNNVPVTVVVEDVSNDSDDDDTQNNNNNNNNNNEAQNLESISNVMEVLQVTQTTARRLLFSTDFNRSLAIQNYYNESQEQQRDPIAASTILSEDAKTNQVPEVMRKYGLGVIPAVQLCEDAVTYLLNVDRLLATHPLEYMPNRCPVTQEQMNEFSDNLPTAFSDAFNREQRRFKIEHLLRVCFGNVRWAITMYQDPESEFMRQWQTEVENILKHQQQSGSAASNNNSSGSKAPMFGSSSSPPITWKSIPPNNISHEQTHFVAARWNAVSNTNTNTKTNKTNTETISNSNQNENTTASKDTSNNDNSSPDVGISGEEARPAAPAKPTKIQTWKPPTSESGGFGDSSGGFGGGGFSTDPAFFVGWTPNSWSSTTTTTGGGWGAPATSGGFNADPALFTGGGKVKRVIDSYGRTFAKQGEETKQNNNDDDKHEDENPQQRKDDEAPSSEKGTTTPSNSSGTQQSSPGFTVGWKPDNWSSTTTTIGGWNSQASGGFKADPALFTSGEQQKSGKIVENVKGGWSLPKRKDDEQQQQPQQSASSTATSSSTGGWGASSDADDSKAKDLGEAEKRALRNAWKSFKTTKYNK